MEKREEEAYPEKGEIEQRRSPRLPVGLKVDYKHGDTWATGQIGNLSESGLFLLAHSPIRPGEEVLLQFLPPDLPAGRPIRVMGEVTRAVKLDSQEEREGCSIGLGIRFKGIHSQSKGDFAQYIKKLTEALGTGKTGGGASPASREKDAGAPPKETEKKITGPEEPLKKSVFDSIWKHLKGKK